MSNEEYEEIRECLRDVILGLSKLLFTLDGVYRRKENDSKESD